ncbi:MAG: DUF427 domain-containing protein [Propionibacteriaceae bacterium]
MGSTVVVESRDPLLFWEDDFPVPSYAFRAEDVRTELFTPTTALPPAQPWFFLPHSEVKRWYDLEADGRVVEHAAWELADAAVAGRIVVSWQPGLLDRWTEEDAEVASHPQDPHHRVDALPSSRHVVVSVGGAVLADSRHPVVLFETGLPTRFYLPTGDVDLSRLETSENASHCPYKGIADRYWSLPDVPNLAWGYTRPTPAVDGIAGRICFYNELVDLTVDGVELPRAVSPFSETKHRPGS